MIEPTEDSNLGYSCRRALAYSQNKDFEARYYQIFPQCYVTLQRTGKTVHIACFLFYLFLFCFCKLCRSWFIFFVRETLFEQKNTTQKTHTQKKHTQKNKKIVSIVEGTDEGIYFNLQKRPTMKGTPTKDGQIPFVYHLSEQRAVSVSDLTTLEIPSHEFGIFFNKSKKDCGMLFCLTIHLDTINE